MRFLLYFSFLLIAMVSCHEKGIEYVCDPCDLPCDTLTFNAPGECPHCGMKLLLKSEVLHEQNLKVNDVKIQTGSSEFLIDGGSGHLNKRIKVYYHKPINYTKESKILLIIPGAGRNGDSYRDSWIEHSEKYNVLILSPMYDEDQYSFEDYHLCGIINQSNLREIAEQIPNTNQLSIDESSLSMEFESNKEKFIFNDFDRIFELAVEATNSKQKKYDIFGHSAGGQILHRFAIFQPKSKADRIIAANSGFYTLPSTDYNFPFGLNNTSINEDSIHQIFTTNLTILIGELDNEDETGGTLLRSPSADIQGLHRFDRGQFFFDFSNKVAKRNGTSTNWKIEIVPKVGHNQKLMAKEAAVYLYKNQN